LLYGITPVEPKLLFENALRITGDVMIGGLASVRVPSFAIVIAVLPVADWIAPTFNVLIVQSPE
jgi:hypothetical protein